MENKLSLFREKFVSRTGRLWTSQTLEGIYEKILVDKLKSNSEMEIFKIVESLKARLLLDLITTKNNKFTNIDLEKQTIEKEQEFLRFKHNSLQDDMISEMGLMSKQIIGNLGGGEGDKRSKLEEIENNYKNDGAGFQSSGKIANIKQIMSNLELDEIMLEYFIPQVSGVSIPELYVIVITSTTFKIIKCPQDNLVESGFGGRLQVDGQQPLDSYPLHNTIVLCRNAIQHGDDDTANRLLDDLYNALIKPVSDAGFVLKKFKRLIIIPHGPLHYLPFAALRSPSGYLIEDIGVIISPSATIWYKLQKKRILELKTFLGFGNPVLSHTNLKPLPETEKELENICKSLGNLECTVKTTIDATEDFLKKTISGKNIVHFATHGDFPAHDVMDLHRIVLSPSQGNDGFLHAEELRQMNLQTTWMVVLSICNGGVYKCGPGNEPYGLFSSLITAGVHNIVGTLWSISDKSGRFIMTEFYKHLLSLGPVDALRTVNIEFIKDNALIRDWASFMIFGEGRPINSQK